MEEKQTSKNNKERERSRKILLDFIGEKDRRKADKEEKEFGFFSSRKEKKLEKSLLSEARENKKISEAEKKNAKFLLSKEIGGGDLPNKKTNNRNQGRENVLKPNFARKGNNVLDKKRGLPDKEKKGFEKPVDKKERRNSKIRAGAAKALKRKKKKQRAKTKSIVAVKKTKKPGQERKKGKRGLLFNVLMFFLLFLLFYLVFLIMLLRFNIDNSFCRNLASRIPTPALITKDGFLNYYSYQELKNKEGPQAALERAVELIALKKLARDNNFKADTEDVGLLKQKLAQRLGIGDINAYLIKAINNTPILLLAN